MPNSTAIHHDVPHYAIFHSRNSLGTCPVCLASEARSWTDMKDRLERALEIARHEVEREQSEQYINIEGGSRG